MSNFKVGDIVERKDYKHDTFLRKVGPGPHVVTAISAKGYWLQINGFTSRGRDLYPWSKDNFVLATDDPLPPAPESVRYNEGAAGYSLEVKSLQGNQYHPNRIRLGVLCGDLAVTHKYVVVDPDTALQLAHDLTRMAMAIKRKEKQNDS